MFWYEERLERFMGNLPGSARCEAAPQRGVPAGGREGTGRKCGERGVDGKTVRHVTSGQRSPAGRERRSSNRGMSRQGAYPDAALGISREDGRQWWSHGGRNGQDGARWCNAEGPAPGVYAVRAPRC
ncbi:hypothetical protein GCM10025734_03520 [Kitasatospora paranensis]